MPEPRKPGSIRDAVLKHFREDPEARLAYLRAKRDAGKATRAETEELVAAHFASKRKPPKRSPKAPPAPGEGTPR